MFDDHEDLSLGDKVVGSLGLPRTQASQRLGGGGSVLISKCMEVQVDDDDWWLGDSIIFRQCSDNNVTIMVTKCLRH